MLADITEILFRAAIVVLGIILLTRLNGLRSFSKLSSFDFAITVAFGSVIASAVISPGESVAYGLTALVGLFAVQRIVSTLRTSWPASRRLFDNEPVLVMEGGRILDGNLAACRMTEGDLYAKLREANAFDLARVHAVVVETTGDVSVLHGTGDPNETVSDEILSGVRR